MPLNLMWTRSSYFCLFFLFKYDELIIKQPSSYTFCIKVVKFWKILEIFGNFWKIKNHCCLVPLTNLGKCRSFRRIRQRRIRYFRCLSFTLVHFMFKDFLIFLDDLSKILNSYKTLSIVCKLILVCSATSSFFLFIFIQFMTISDFRSAGIDSFLILSIRLDLVMTAFSNSFSSIKWGGESAGSSITSVWMLSNIIS